jgi:hypothetical protein
LWGARLDGSYRDKWKTVIEKMMIRAKVATGKAFDQKLLKEEVWLLAFQPGD